MKKFFLLALFAIAWRALSTGFVGVGTGCFPEREAREYARQMNGESPNIVHFIVPCEKAKQWLKGEREEPKRPTI